jgi:hypothetical protein
VTFDAVRYLQPVQSVADSALTSAELHCPPHVDHATVTAFPLDKAGVLFGGGNSGDTSNATWVFDEASRLWSRAQHVGPMPDARCGHCAVAMSDVPAATALRTSSHRTTACPAPASGPADEPIVLIFGGANMQHGLYYNDVWEFNVRRRTWRLVHPGSDTRCSRALTPMLGAGDAAGHGPGAPPPTPRWKAVCGALEKRLFVFGGESSDFEVLGDLHVFNQATGMWQAIRTHCVPSPSPRCMHAACTVGDKLVVIGGVGPNSAETVDDDTWVLDMRTLLWRLVGGGHDRSAKPSRTMTVEASPFVIPGATGGGGFGAPAASSAVFHAPVVDSDSGSDAEVVPGTEVSFSMASVASSRAQRTRRVLEGHVALPFDDLVMVHGGRFGRDGFNNDVYLLDVPNEKWLRLPAADGAHGGAGGRVTAAQRPPARCFHCACPVTQYNATQPMSQALSLGALASSGIHFTDDKESGQYIAALQASLDQQTAFTGVLFAHNSVPVMAHNTAGLVFGGSGGTAARHEFNDLYRVRLGGAEVPKTAPVAPAQ